ncbi:peptidoglycan DD-metalloendopeptidase family protein [Bradyrhizobium sp. U87765 SZCCT0131]|uniref:peptidoglycan DD-metalloendopeptidase family protein n=1 Tax=unclassified Bradyrhizobium TaxID=2631580 RepID=UPI001BAA26DE|nr:MULTISPECIES: peptidoglycan DD-metalloendopeptidase family protein [unclassified Bradyrhizobium]MBR1220098.1 peptidoglycan DD-metalloendopeptidase family protein [Bradyrhizobium sp. U87765 SZCCT0131]MBR1263446.1 peptidoglycan DD-metalloendopeptidase family protein [Bradyrhizobium sp. U87765 SZCCT0134]MBR1309015.1 peptidoglycan DD-metalloendopeptidase family protein [Bradyrhizobium sp. U87765 SZCCT0110]MBR1323778.1 peptidoglycan DD-metalloendopeptidase family protein [Bradyrhizobium sp. U8776
MSRVVELLRSRRVPQIAALALVSVGFAGCSADTSSRFSQSGFGWRGQEATGSVPQQYAQPQPQYQQPQYGQPQYAPGPVESRPLPQYTRPQYSQAPMPPISAPQSYPTSGVSSGGGGHGMASYTPPAAYTPPPARPIETTATVAPRSVAAAPAAGTAIIVGTSDTVDVLARRYNVSPAAILQANRLSGPRALQPGQRLIIPHPTVAAAAAPPPALAPAPATRAATVPGTVHVVNRGDTLMSIARRNNVPLSQLAKANNLPANSQLKVGMKINVPARTAEAAPVAAQPAAPAVADARPVAAPAAAPAKVASVEPTQKALLANPTAPVAEAEPVKAADATSGLPSFRWPVRGRVITAYGAKNNGKQNDGINVAVPEGTPIKAAEDGVVAYSGSELKGYGNLVLVRHSNGYVTAYAHASELMVKRGETIKRGQVIAKSGQTGEVGSPQLHFEIRKGSSPVDPLQFLNGA